MEIREVLTERRRYMELLLMGDEQEDMIELYLERGEMFALHEGDVPVAVCVITQEAENLFELKNLAVSPGFRRRGYGSRLAPVCGAGPPHGSGNGRSSRHACLLPALRLLGMPPRNRVLHEVLQASHF